MSLVVGSKAWTDYPFTELGDMAGEIAPMREVEVLSYDGDKYVEVSFDGHLLTVKAGYLHDRKDALVRWREEYCGD